MTDDNLNVTLDDYIWAAQEPNYVVETQSPTLSGITLTPGQEKALEEIMGAFQDNQTRRLLTGYAGTGKTTLMQAVALRLKAQGVKTIMTAPTHKAVSVLARKLREAGIEAPTGTIHSLLCLAPKSDGKGGTILQRTGKPSAASEFDAVIIDECSMIGEDLMKFIESDLGGQFVLYVGDPAQLPPVNEVASKAFSCQHRSNLDTIVRQAASNPILAAATTLRHSQGGPVDWSWVHDASSADQGVFLAGENGDDWMREGFTGAEFAADNDFCRYLCWTNDRVAAVNKKVRYWIYGETPTPFVADERVLCRNPILAGESSREVAFNTNDEAVVASVEAEDKTYSFDKKYATSNAPAVDGWSMTVPTWRVTLRRPMGIDVVCWMPQDPQDIRKLEERLRTEARIQKTRWLELFDFKDKIADLRSVYAMTVHTSQGSTFGNVFVDLGDIQKRERSNLREMQQLLYVAVTRPSHALILVG